MKHSKFSTLLLFLTVFIFNYSCFAATWYVRPSGGSYGLEDGTSYANAWDGFSSIIWGGSGVIAGDTLYVCGTHYDKMLVGASGSSASPITIRGDYETSPGIIDGSKDIKYARGWTETSSGSNKWYTETWYTMYVLLNDKFGKKVDSLDDLDQDGEWFYSNPPARIYLYSNSDPEQSTTFETILTGTTSKENGIVVDDKDYITISDLTFMRIQCRHTLYSDTDGAVLIKNSQYCKVENNHMSQCGRGVMVAGESDYCTVENNFIEKSFLYGAGCYWYARPIYSVSNHVTIRRNTIDGLITFYDDTTLMAGTGIDLQIQNYPDYYCYGAQIYRNEVRHVGWYGIRCQQFITNTGIQPVDIDVYENYIHDSKQSNGTGEEDGIAFGCNAGDVSNHFTGVNIYRNIIYNFVNTGVIACNYWDDVNIYANLIGKCGYDGAGGIYLSTSSLKSCNIENNTIYDCHQEGIVCYTAFAGGNGVKINNNIITDISYSLSGHGKAVYVSSASAPYVSGGYNCFYDIDGSPTTVNFTNTNGITQDPLFINSSAGNFHLNASSPCIGEGIDVGLDYDLDNNPVSQTFDIGCYNGISYGLQCYLKLDEGTGDDVYDDTSNDVDGTFSWNLDPSECWIDGWIGKGVSFTSNSWDKHIDCDDSSPLDGMTNYSISVWVKPDTSSSGDGNRAILQKWGANPDGFLLRLESSDDIVLLQCANDSAWNHNRISYPFPHDNKFHHIAVTFSYDGVTTCVTQLFLDGVLVDTGGDDDLIPNISTSTSDLQIGRGVFNGIIDEVKLYKRVLTEKEIWDIAVWNIAN